MTHYAVMKDKHRQAKVYKIEVSKKDGSKKRTDGKKVKSSVPVYTNKSVCVKQHKQMLKPKK